LFGRFIFDKAKPNTPLTLDKPANEPKSSNARPE